MHSLVRGKQGNSHAWNATGYHIQLKYDQTSLAGHEMAHIHSKICISNVQLKAHLCTDLNVQARQYVLYLSVKIQGRKYQSVPGQYCSVPIGTELFGSDQTWLIKRFKLKWKIFFLNFPSISFIFTIRSLWFPRKIAIFFIFWSIFGKFSDYLDNFVQIFSYLWHGPL